MFSQVRVRYAPSPTGHLHIGNARAALFNYLFARHYGGSFIIRIEDTDQKRNIDGGDQQQLQYLHWLGIDWDESIDRPGPVGPYRQSERIAIYNQYVQQLLERGQAYFCYCTEEELEAEREEQKARGEMIRYSGKHRNLTAEQRQAFAEEGRQPSIRFRVPDHGEVSFHDLVKEDVSFDVAGMGDFVIVKKDGMPTYNFAAVIDDHLMEITHVLRGDDHLSNTPRQLLMYEALGWTPPQFAHMTLIVNEEHKKLSKRDESVIQFVEQYKERGYLPEALFNFIALLGWSPGGEEEIFSKDELIAIFDAQRLSKSPAVFDMDKLKWMNSHYIKGLSEDRLLQLSIPYLQSAGYVPLELSAEDEQWARQAVSLFQDRLQYGAEITELMSTFFQEDLVFEHEEHEVLQDEAAGDVLRHFFSEVGAMEQFTAELIKAKIKEVQNKTGVKGKKLFMPIRVACTGHAHGPDLTQSLALLGQERVLRRLEAVLDMI